MKVSHGLWMSAMSDVKKGSECIGAALEEKNSLISIGMNLHQLWKLCSLYDKRGMVEKQKIFLKELNQH